MKCVADCPSDAITIETGEINNSCIHCGHCVAVCPVGAVLPGLGSVVPLKKHGVIAEGFSAFSASIRSCRSYSRKEVPAEIILSLIENMKHYPSASNARNVEVIVVNNKALIKKLNDLTASTLLKALGFLTNPVISFFIKHFAKGVKIQSLINYKNKYNKRAETNTSQICHNAPLVLLFHGPCEKYSLAKDDALIWATYTTLYANTLELGSCFIGFIVKAMERNKSMRKVFGVPEKHAVYAALTLGYPKLKYHNETSRKAPSHKLLKTEE
jgi:nitroreductase